MRPFLLYHWSPVSRRNGILRHGLCPRKRGQLTAWRPPYVCWCRYPNTAWALSATHASTSGDWDLWSTWSDHVGPYTTLNTSRHPKKCWWMTEYRSSQRVPKSKLWHVGTRRFTKRAPRTAP